MKTFKAEKQEVKVKIDCMLILNDIKQNLLSENAAIASCNPWPGQYLFSFLEKFLENFGSRFS
jgi:hypothetical protein